MMVAAALAMADSWRMLVFKAGWRCVGGLELSWCKALPSDALDETRQPSITGLPACNKARNLAFFYGNYIQ